MLRRLDRARPWNPSGYVCHACRLRLPPLQRSQVRHESTSTDSHSRESTGGSDAQQYPPPEAVEDSWLSNFNSMSSDNSVPTRNVAEKGGSLTPKRGRRGRNGIRSLRIKRHAALAPAAKKRENLTVRSLDPPPRSRPTGEVNKGTSEEHHAPQDMRPDEGGPAIRDQFDNVVDGLKESFAVQHEGPSAASDGDATARVSRDIKMSPSRRRRANLTARAAIKIAGSSTTSERGIPATVEPTTSEAYLLKKLQSNDEPDRSNSEAPWLFKSLIRNSSWLFGQMSQTKKEPGQSKSPSQPEPSAAEEKSIVFGVDKETSSSPGDFASPRMVTVRSPAFEEPVTVADQLALSGLDTLYKSGWNLKLAPGRIDASAEGRAPKSKNKENPATSAEGKKKEPTVSVEKKAAKRKLAATAAGDTKSGAKSIKGRKSSPRGEIVKIGRRERTKQGRATGRIVIGRTNQAPNAAAEETADLAGTTEYSPHAATLEPKSLNIIPLDIPQPAVPGLEHGLDRVLFNSGVYQLQDPHSRVYNFDPYLQKVMPVVEFDFNALKEYKTSSEDDTLAQLASEYNKRYIGSTSSMTSVLQQFHYLLSAFRPLNLAMMSRGFPDKLDTFTALSRAPDAIFLRWKDGSYAIDADKEHDNPNVLMMLGKSMEKLLTLPPSEYERYRKSDPRSVSEEERTAPEAYQYTTMGDFLMRSQLDTYDPRLPGTGTFDLKTRAVVSVRHSTEDFERMTGYEIHTLQGRFESYEREYYDMVRATMLKYMLQARMGRMEGIFVTYHNVARIFGFQYMPMPEMDRILHGQIDRILGDQEFKASLGMLNKVFDLATAKYPGRSIRFHFEVTQENLSSGDLPVMLVFGEPIDDEDIDRIQAAPKARTAEFERRMMGIEERQDSESSWNAEAGQNGDTAKSSFASSKDTGNASEESTPAINDAPTTEEPTSASSQPASNSSQDDKELSPLFSASIFCKSTVNGIEVERPSRLRDVDDWKIDYFIQELPSHKKVWARYEDMKTKRRNVYAKAREEELATAAAVAENSRFGKMSEKARAHKGYIGFLESMSERGRAFREMTDEFEAGREPMVVGQPIRRSEAVAEQVEGVEDYMGWLYGKGRA